MCSIIKDSVDKTKIKNQKKEKNVVLETSMDEEDSEDKKKIKNKEEKDIKPKNKIINSIVSSFYGKPTPKAKQDKEKEKNESEEEADEHCINEEEESYEGDENQSYSKEKQEKLNDSRILKQLDTSTEKKRESSQEKLNIFVLYEINDTINYPEYLPFWYILINKKYNCIRGPFSTDELIQMYDDNLLKNDTQIRPFDIYKPKKMKSSYFSLSDIKDRVVTELFFEYYEINERVRKIGEKKEKLELGWEKKEDKKEENLKGNNESKSKNTRKKRNKKGKWINYDDLI